MPGHIPRQPYSYRSDPKVAPFPDDNPIIVFDGMCALCSGWVQFVLRRDPHAQFRFLPAQSALGRALYEHYGLDPEIYESNILIADGVALFKSDGTLRMFERLGWPWSAMTAFRAVPVGWRDRAYELVARNRLAWFGVRETCFKPGPADDDRFLA